jgi:PAS domain S-box-containing protein
VVRYSSGAVASGNELHISSPTCQACHQFPPSQRMSSRVIDAQGGSILRTVMPFRNQERCHRCHDASNRINGILIYDVDTAGIRAAANRDLRWMVVVTVTIALLLVAAIALVVRFALLRRLQRFETTARQISQGKLDQRVPVTSSDTISWLAREFNTMADSVTGLVGQVRTERERLETIINSIDDGIVVLDADRTVLAANDAFLRRIDRARDAMLGCSCRELPAGTCTAADCPTVACLQTGHRQVRICERRRPDGTSVWEEVHACPIGGGSDGTGHVVEVWRDITDRRAAEARLAESHRLASLGMLASGFSHEMNTPLATVLTCVEGIARDAQGGNDGGRDWVRVRETAAIAREQILRCRGITQHFLRLSRGQPSTGDLVDVHAVLAAVCRLTSPTASAHGVHVEVESNGGSIRVRADEADLINLLLNGIQACDDGGTVTLAARLDDAVHVTVSDTGRGIAPEHQKHIFEPFVSLSHDGTGLGLFIALNFVRKWGGDITVRSAVGHGATFDIALPALAAAPQELAG